MKKGFFLPVIMLTATIVFIITSAIITLTLTNYHMAKKQNSSVSALNISEAGVNYYLWRLSHNNQDYCDGNACTGSAPYGPYVHSYKDNNGNVVGQYTITVTPPVAGGNSVTVKVQGQKDPTGEKRTVVAQIGMPSFAQYAFASNTEAWFGSNETTKGLVMSNKGIHFDGTAQGPVTAASNAYVPASCFGGNGSTTHAGIWGDADATSKSYWNFPVPAIDFNHITADFNDLKTAAQTANGLYLPSLQDAQGHKTYDGYLLELQGTTVRVSKVTATQDDGSSNNNCTKHSKHYSLISSTTPPVVVGTYPLPANGVIFVEDNLWIWGNLSQKLTVAAARLSGLDAGIYLKNDITYNTYDGSAMLGLVTQSDIVVNSESENNLRIDAFLLSQKGKVFRPNYSGNVKDNIHVYGGIASSSWWTWSWVSGSTVISGYRTTTQEYDNFLALTPPPLFPTTGSYAILSWKEEPVI